MENVPLDSSFDTSFLEDQTLALTSLMLLTQ